MTSVRTLFLAAALLSHLLSHLGSAAAAGQNGGPSPAAKLGGPAAGVLGSGRVFNIVEWDGGELPGVYERSAQLPLTMEDVRKLAASEFGDEAILRMLQERRCACDASVDALLELKKTGVSQAVVEAVSLHSLPPNRSLDLVISLDFEGLGGEAAVSTTARRGYLYLIIPDGGRERVFIGNLRTILAGRWQREAMVDNTDLLLPKNVRRITFAAQVPLRTYGARSALVFTSTKPDIYSATDIPDADRQGALEFAFNYPPSSVERRCSLQALYRQDALVPGSWHMERSHFECEWE
jgi:hypothetical protein